MEDGLNWRKWFSRFGDSGRDSYRLSVKFFECEQRITIEEVYQAFAARFSEERGVGVASKSEDRKDEDFEAGYRAAWVRVIQEACKNLGYDDPEAGKVSWITEREQAVSALRSICEEFGDNEWEPGLHFADVVEKHLNKHLQRR